MKGDKFCEDKIKITNAVFINSIVKDLNSLSLLSTQLFHRQCKRQAW